MNATEQFLVNLASSLYAYGTPTHSLWYHMKQVAKGLGRADTDFTVFPTYMMIGFRHDDEPAAYPLFFLTNAGFDVYKLALVEELARRVASYATAQTYIGAPRAQRRLSQVDVSRFHPPPQQARNNRNPRPGLLRAMTMGSVSSLNRSSSLPSIAPETGGGGLDRRPSRLNRFRNIVSEVIKGKGRAMETPASVLPGGGNADLESAMLHSPTDMSDHEEDEQLDLKRWILELAAHGHDIFAGRGNKPKKHKKHRSRVGKKSGSSSDSSDSSSSSSSSSDDDEGASNPSRPLLSRRRPKRQDDAHNAEPSTATATSGNDKPANNTSTPSQDGRHKPSKEDLTSAFEIIAVEDANARLKQIVQLPDYYPEWVQYLLSGLAAAGAAGLFFDGQWLDVLVSGILGTVVAWLGGLCESQRTMGKVYEFLGAALVAFTVRTLIGLGVPLCYSASILSSSMFLLQGVTITLALVELGTRHMISGTSRLAYGIVMTGLIGYGLDLGTTLSAGMFHEPKLPDDMPATCPGLSSTAKLLLFLPTSLTLSMGLGAHPVQLPMLSVISAIGYAVYNLAATRFSDNLASAIGSFAIGVSSNLHARWSKSPAIVNDLGGLNMLFPGALAVRGIMKIIGGDGNDDIANGLALSLNVLVVGLSLGVGMFMASIVAPLPSMRMPGSRRGKGKGPLIDNLHF
ncbi:uncharacterized protein EV422DRAFT_530463 [Fimicolochytrium jonesii]|uniref:uncharacterized protein n=1 Tax=Fimicolochytrium jonesii TaxID=1396493 RepID=UPI0022FE62E3|nr:uncharacterized protein EV422DRAFT_530463 [Fimicolochytrium jonesii]KAI8820852.1 hypothetical protein EV422DRAFT_530463 [Fimicolochytrium jonesii]